MSFNLWSENNPEALNELKPDLGKRDWDSLTTNEKDIIWEYLKYYLFEREKTFNPEYVGNKYQINYRLNTDDPVLQRSIVERITFSIKGLKLLYKYKNYTPLTLYHPSYNNIFKDFLNIFMTKPRDVVYEMLSLYAKHIIIKQKEEQLSPPFEDEDQKNYIQRIEIEIWKDFDDFANHLNEIFNDFGLNVNLSHNGIIPVHEEIITEKIYVPVLSILRNGKWDKVNEFLNNSFKYFIEHNYNECISCSISALQAYLQIEVYGETGKGEIADLLKIVHERKGYKKNDNAYNIIKSIESYLGRTRRENTDVHSSKIENATEKDARLVLNMVMVILEYYIT